MADVIKLSCNSQRFSSSLLTSFSSSLNTCQWAFPRNQGGVHKGVVSVSDISSVGCGFVSPIAFGPRRQLGSFRLQMHATVTETEQPKWWERNAGPNMIDIHSTQEFLNALSEAGDRLVIVEFYGTWCASCRALFPKLCRTAQEHPDILFLKVNFDENKPMCKNLNVKVLPYFHFYRGADGQLEAFSCSLAKVICIRITASSLAVFFHFYLVKVNLIFHQWFHQFRMETTIKRGLCVWRSTWMRWIYGRPLKSIMSLASPHQLIMRHKSKSQKEKRAITLEGKVCLLVAISLTIFTIIMSLKTAKAMRACLKEEHARDERIKGMQVLNLIRKFEL